MSNPTVFDDTSAEHLIEEIQKLIDEIPVIDKDKVEKYKKLIQTKGLAGLQNDDKDSPAALRLADKILSFERDLFGK